MYQLTLLLTALFTFNVATIVEKTPDNSILDSRIIYKTLEELELEDILFNPTNNFTVGNLDAVSIEVIDIEEEVELNFDTKTYLPANFNALQGMHDLDWNTIELLELEEEIELGFDTQTYLPEGFNALQGLHDLDWKTIELVELEEDIELGFDTQAYLPKGFNPYKDVECQKVCLY